MAAAWLCEGAEPAWTTTRSHPGFAAASPPSGYPGSCCLVRRRLPCFCAPFLLMPPTPIPLPLLRYARAHLHVVLVLVLVVVVVVLLLLLLVLLLSSRGAGAKVILAGRLCLACAESASAEGTGQAGTGVGWRAPADWAIGRASERRLALRPWRCAPADSAPLTLTTHALTLPHRPQRACTRAPPLRLCRGTNARPAAQIRGTRPF